MFSFSSQRILEQRFKSRKTEPAVLCNILTGDKISDLILEHFRKSINVAAYLVAQF